MEGDSDQKTFVIETVSYNTQTSEGDSNHVFLNDDSLVICLEDGTPLEYVTCYEGGNLFTSKTDTENLTNVTSVKRLCETSTKLGEDSKGKEKRKVVLNSVQNFPKRKPELELKPSQPQNRGGKGFIRYGLKHLVIDQQTMISPREFKTQLTNTKDIISSPVLAPCTKLQMRQMLSGITRLFAHPARKIPNPKLLQLYVTNCTSRRQPNEETFSDMNLLPVGYQTPVDPSTIKRITRKRRNSSEKAELRVAKEKLYTSAAAGGDHKYSKRVPLSENCDKYTLFNVSIKEESLEDNSEVVYEMYEAEDGKVALNLQSVKKEKGISTDETHQKNNDNHQDEIKDEPCDLIKSNEQIKEENCEEEQTVIIQKLDQLTDLGQKNLELLLAAAKESKEAPVHSLEQIMAMCNNSDMEKTIIIVQNGEIDEILGPNSELVSVKTYQN